MKTGGHAFPCRTGPNCAEVGMTLRDYLAGQALVALIPRIDGDIEDFDFDYFKEKFAHVFGKAAYIVADATLEVREKTE